MYSFSFVDWYFRIINLIDVFGRKSCKNNAPSNLLYHNFCNYEVYGN
jgi:hypothetical protein